MWTFMGNTRMYNALRDYGDRISQIGLFSFKVRATGEIYETGSRRGIQTEHAPKLGRMLDRLDASTAPQDMNLPGYRLHMLKGDRKDMWSVTVSGNWRMTFYFEGEDAYLVDYIDYH